MHLLVLLSTVLGATQHHFQTFQETVTQNVENTPETTEMTEKNLMSNYVLIIRSISSVLNDWGI